MTEALSYTNRIELKYYQNSFSIDFSTFDYSMANDAKYIYKLIPYDKDWGVPSSLNLQLIKFVAGYLSVTCKSIQCFRCMGEDETVLQIVITPPFGNRLGLCHLYNADLYGNVYDIQTNP